MEPLPSFWPHRGIALRACVWFGKRAPPQDVLYSPSTPERQSLFESHRQRRWLTCWSYYMPAQIAAIVYPQPVVIGTLPGGTFSVANFTRSGLTVGYCGTG